jgi:DedD protein
VLGALGLIVLPVLFDFTDPSRVDRSSKLPAAPEMSVVAVDKAVRPTTVDGSSLKTAIFDVDKLIPASADDKPIGLDEKNMPKRWYIKVGTFDNKGNANAALNLLRKKGFKAFLNNMQGLNKTRYQLWVGPNIDKRRAQLDQGKIDRELKVESKIFAAVL